MSLINLAGERVYLQAKPVRVSPVRDPKVRARNFSWLRVQRKLGLTIAETARLVNRPDSTVDAGLRWAAAEEERLAAAEIEACRPEILDEKSGLDVDDVLYLIGEYPPGSEVGSVPAIREFLGRMIHKVEALGYDVSGLTVALAGAA